MKHGYWGPAFADREIQDALRARSQDLTRAQCCTKEFETERALCDFTADRIAEGQVVGWFQGRMEFGPRALGGRSILADPRGPEVQRTVNLKIKFRESFRPFAPSVRAERAAEYFDLAVASPYMLLVAQVRGASIEGVGLDRLRHVDSPVPAVTHVDGSARVQTVHEGTNPLFYRLLGAFEERTGCGVLVNTSFNVRGEPIVCTPEDAYRCFRRTHIDALAIGPCLVRKEALPDAGEAVYTAEEVAQVYGLD
jgi:carbamoyltransferase